MKIYVITGHAKSGKTTFGNILRDKLKEYGYKPCVMQITSPLYHYAEDYFEWDSRQDEKPREFLQKFGITIGNQNLVIALFAALILIMLTLPIGHIVKVNKMLNF